MNQHIRELLDKMTLKEKAAFCSGADFWHTAALKRLNVNSIMMCDGPHGLRKQIETKSDTGLQESLPATCFPTASAIAASWDIELVRKVGSAIAEECREEDVHILLGPGINIKRSPLCGRNFEYYSEDPFLTSELAIGFIQGVQSRGVGTCIKHFAVNSQEYRRMIIDSVVDKRALREIYLYAFEQAIKRAKPWSIMSSYNKINGTYASENKELLTNILREEWGFEGAVITDWGAVNEIVSGLKAGLNLEMPSSSGINSHRIIDAVNKGSLSMEVLDNAVAEIISLVSKANEKKSIIYMYDHYANQKLAKIAALECIVLLKNKDKILPLHHNEKIAVIGEMAVSPRYQGTGSSKVNPTEIKYALQELSSFTKNIIYAQGYELDSDETNEHLEAEAMIAAVEAETVVIFAGLPDAYESEGFDRKNLDLPRNQNELIKKVSEKNKKVIVVLSNGAPVTMPWIDQVQAVVEGYLSGQSGAAAMADILFGVVSPCGKLAETFPLSVEDTPCYNYFPSGPSTVEYRESIYVGYRYYQKAHKDILFPFGHGLSYTSFSYSNLALSTKNIDGTIQISVSLQVKNTGYFPGKEIIQIYVKDLRPRIFKPLMELKGFSKVYLNAGEAKKVEIQLDQKSFSFFDVEDNSWKMYSGKYEILAACSSEDIRLQGTVIVRADNDYAPGLTSKEIPSYYQINDKKLSIPTLEFKTLYGEELPSNKKKLPGEYDLESTLGDVKKSFTGKLLYKTASARIVASDKKEKKHNDSVKGNKNKNKKSSSTLMQQAMADEMPFKSLVVFSGGIFDYEMADGLLLMLNKQMKIGLSKLKNAYFTKKKRR